MLPASDYDPPFYLRSGHLQSILPSLFRRVDGVSYTRERIATADGDFLDLDWSTVSGDRLVVLSHGLEGNAQRAYVRGMVRAVNRAGFSALAWNYRGCSGEPNRRLRFCHNGSIDDLHTVVSHATRRYPRIFLVGFSMGGNLSLLYLGKMAAALGPALEGAVAFSVPCDLGDAARALARRENALYMRYFLRSLHAKIRTMMARFPGEIDDRDFEKIRSFRDFDERYTAPLHGFAGAEDYWQRCSCRPWLAAIRVPTLIVNAADDPFLADGCYPLAEAAANPLVTLQIPRYGGHVGFVGGAGDGCYWSETRAVAFLGAPGRPAGTAGAFPRGFPAATRI